MIYMRGLKIKDMLAIMDFIYHGEVNIFQNDLDEFLSLAEDLQLKGLTGSSREESSPQSVAEENKSSWQQLTLMPKNITPKSQKIIPNKNLMGKVHIQCTLYNCGPPHLSWITLEIKIYETNCTRKLKLFV